RYSMKPVDVDAKYVILAASTLENTRLLLLSAKGGLANSSGTLGHYMMDQVGGGGVSGILPKLKGGPSRLDDGKAAGITIPNFQNIDKKTERKDFIRGYVMNATGGQTDFQQKAEELFRKAGGEVMPGSVRRSESGRRGALGGSIHEVGTARMSADPKDGVLNSFCQTHDIANLYVFGGNAFPSTGDKHPT